MAAYCRGFCLFVLLIGLAANLPAARAAETEPIKFPDTQYEPAEWADVDGWVNDDHAAAFSTFLASCRVLTTTRQRSGRGADWGQPCQRDIRCNESYRGEGGI